MAFDPDNPAAGPIYQGKNLAAEKQDLPTERAIWVPNRGWTVTRDFVTENARWQDELPPAFEEHPNYPGARFSRATSRQRGVLTMVQFLWEPRLEHEDGGPTFEGCPPDEITEQAGILQAPIDTHPKFLSDWAQFWNFKQRKFNPVQDAFDLGLVGVQNYDAGTFTVSETQYFSAKPSSVQNDINQLVDPPGQMSSGGLKQWKISSGSVNLAGECWAKNLIYEFNEPGWNEEIYG